MYAIIAEYKLDAPLIMETKPLTYDEALNRMREFASSPSGIRCAMFKLEFAEGNKTLDQGDEQ